MSYKLNFCQIITTSASWWGRACLWLSLFGIEVLTTVMAQTVPAQTQLPMGGSIVTGQASIQRAGSALNIQQASHRAAIDWASFNVGEKAQVNFVQPSANAVMLNRVLDSNPSNVFGKITSNGQIFLSNPNGIYFSPTSRVEVGGFLATTLGWGDGLSSIGAMSLKGSSKSGLIWNQGSISAQDGGYVGFFAPRIKNEGLIQAKVGAVSLTSGEGVTLQFKERELIKLQVDQGTLDGLIQNNGLIKADGGWVLMTAKAANTLANSVIQNTGTVQAQTLENRNGRILLLGDSAAGTLQVDGKLDASAPIKGDGGFVETSAAKVQIANAAVVTTKAMQGKSGKWLIDPHDYTVAATGGDQTGANLSSNLENGDVELESATGGKSGSGNININDNVTWFSNTKLTLTASNNVNVNANIYAWNALASLVVNPNTTQHGEIASGAGELKLGPGGTIGLPNVSPSSSTSLVIAGEPYTVINSLGAPGSTTGLDLQGISGNLSGRYALGSNIDASSTSSWNAGAGFSSIGGALLQPFVGKINGLGNYISKLYINNTHYYLGMLAINQGQVSNIGLDGGEVIGGNYYIGSLVGNNQGMISNSHSTASVTSTSWVYAIGGLVGTNSGTISDSFATGNVSSGNSTWAIGGLSGLNSGLIEKSYAMGNVEAGNNSGGIGNISRGGGGLIGTNSGTITDSHSTGNVSLLGSGGDFGGFVGFQTGVIRRSYG